MIRRKSTSSASDNRPFFDWLDRQGVRGGALQAGSVLARLADGPAEKPVRRSPGAHGEKDVTRVLMLLCQKIGSTGSGVVVKEIVDRAQCKGVRHAILCGGYKDDEPSRLFLRPPEHLDQVLFLSDPAIGLPFPIAGMSNLMPYDSKAFKNLTLAELNAYVSVWSSRIKSLTARFRPDILHVHHLWLLAAVAALSVPDLPLVVSIHGTDLHRADDAPHLKSLVDPWVVRFEKVIALTEESVSLALRKYRLKKHTCAVLGNGFNEDLFHPDREADSDVLSRYAIPPLGGKKVILFVGKYERWKASPG